MTADSTIRILLIDDHKSFVEAMTMVIETQRPRMEVIGAASTAEDALVAAVHHLVADGAPGLAPGVDVVPGACEIQRMPASRRCRASLPS